MRKIAFAVVLSFAVAAHALNWSTHGPRGGEITAVVFAAADPGTIYAAGGGGVFRSTDAGDSWTDVSGPLHDIVHLVVDPTNARAVYASSATKIWQTIDGGASWIDITKGTSSSGRLTTLLIDPQHPSTLYFASGCYVSFDIPDSDLYTAGLYKSTDGGATWKPAMNGLIPYHHCVQELALDPAAPQHLIFEPPYSDWGVPESFDGGEHWSTTRDLVPTFALIDDPQFPLTHYGLGVYFHQLVVSGDGGLTWTGVNGSGIPNGNRSVTDLAIDRVTRRLFCVSGDALFRSGSGGLSWAKIDAPPAPNHLAVDSGAGWLFLATKLGLHRAPLGSFGPWTAMPLADIGSKATNVAVDPHDPAVVFTRTFDYYNSDSLRWHGRIFVSRDYGRSWTLVHEGDDPVLSSTMTVDANGNLLTLFRTVSSGYSGHLMRLDPHNGSLVDLHLTLVFLSAIATEAGNANVIHVAAESKIFTTYDGGATWHPSGENDATSLAIDPDNPQQIFAGSQLGMLKSEDRGLTWTKIDSLHTGRVVIAPSKTSTIYRITNDPLIGRGNASLWRSDDSGATWTPLQWPGTSELTSLVVDPRDDRSLWIVASSEYSPLSSDHFMFHSGDGGITWQPALSNLPALPVDLAIDRLGIMMHAAMGNTGVWDAQLETHRRAAAH